MEEKHQIQIDEEKHQIQINGVAFRILNRIKKEMKAQGKSVSYSAAIVEQDEIRKIKSKIDMAKDMLMRKY